MQRIKRIFLTIGCILLLAVSWFTALTSKSDAQKQIDLLEQANAYIKDEVYILAVPLLEEAINYKGPHVLEAENALKLTYLNLMNQSGYSRKYVDLLERQMAREDVEPEIFREASDYYFDRSKESEALSILKNGIAKTGSEELVECYEDMRYQYEVTWNAYQDVTNIYRGTVQVKQNGYWGLASAAGNLIIPCEYDWISTYDNGRAIVLKDNVIFAVDGNNNRIALLHTEASGFGNYSENRLGIQTSQGWLLASGEFNVGSVYFDELGMFSNGYAPAKINGKWGLVDTSGGEWLVPAEYDGIIQDNLNRCFSQNSCFALKNGLVYLLVDGEETGKTYEDARPFSDGWAAVKKDGKWGFIDAVGTLQIDYQFEDALSFGQHLAAVRQGDLWGYISLQGEWAIEPVFQEARNFSNGHAPVKTDRGWQFISLLEFEESDHGMF